MHPVFPGCGVIKKGPGGVSCPVFIIMKKMRSNTIHFFELFYDDLIFRTGGTNSFLNFSVAGILAATIHTVF